MLSHCEQKKTEKKGEKEGRNGVVLHFARLRGGGAQRELWMRTETTGRGEQNRVERTTEEKKETSSQSSGQ